MAHLRVPLDIRRQSDEETTKGLYLFVLSISLFLPRVIDNMILVALSQDCYIRRCLRPRYTESSYNSIHVWARPQTQTESTVDLSKKWRWNFTDLVHGIEETEEEWTTRIREDKTSASLLFFAFPCTSSLHFLNDYHSWTRKPWCVTSGAKTPNSAVSLMRWWWFVVVTFVVLRKMLVVCWLSSLEVGTGIYY